MTTRGTDERVGQMDGPAALPRKNGELVFEAPWESRAFGLAVAMSDQDQYAWEDFRQRLIAEIGVADASGAPTSYYERWLAAFESLLIERGFISREELNQRTAEYASGARDDDDHDDHARCVGARFGWGEDRGTLQTGRRDSTSQCVDSLTH